MGAEYASSVILGFLAFALAMAHYRWDNDLVRHLSGVGAVVFTVAAFAVATMPMLGALEMTRVQAIGMPIGAMIFFLALGWPTIERYAGFRPAVATPTSTPSAPSAVSVAGPPLLHLLYYSDKFHVFNERPNAYLEIWGTKLGDGPKSLGPKKLISPGAPYDLFVSPTLKTDMLRVVPTDKPLSVPFVLYLKSDDLKYVARFTLVMHNSKGVISIDVQPDAVEREDWTDDSPPQTSSASGFGTRAATPMQRVQQQVADSFPG